MKNLAVTATAALLLSSPAFATTYFSTPQVGDTVVYSDVQDQDDLFGAPTLTGDTLTFTPQGFKAQAEGLFGADLTDGFLSTLIEAKPGESIQGFTLTEAGAFRLTAAGGAGTAATAVDVSVIIKATVLATDDASFNTPVLLEVDESIFSANVADGALGRSWRNSVNVDIASLAAGAGVVGNVTKVRLTLDNQLEATSELGTIAFIDKKAIGGVTITVPEPTSALFVLGAGAMLLRRRVAA